MTHSFRFSAVTHSESESEWTYRTWFRPKVQVSVHWSVSKSSVPQYTHSKWSNHWLRLHHNISNHRDCSTNNNSVRRECCYNGFQSSTWQSSSICCSKYSNYYPHVYRNCNHYTYWIVSILHSDQNLRSRWWSRNTYCPTWWSLWLVCSHHVSRQVSDCKKTMKWKDEHTFNCRLRGRCCLNQQNES